MHYLAKHFNSPDDSTPVKLKTEFENNQVLTNYGLEFCGEYYPCSLINRKKYENTAKTFIITNYYTRISGEHDEQSTYIKAKEQVIWYYNEYGKPYKLMYSKGMLNNPTYFTYSAKEYKRTTIPFKENFENDFNEAREEITRSYFPCLEIFDSEPLNDEVLNNYNFVITGNGRTATQQILKIWARLNGLKNISTVPRKRIKNIIVNLSIFPVVESSFFKQVEIAAANKLESWLNIDINQFLGLAYNKVYKDDFKISVDLIKKSRLEEIQKLYKLLAEHPYNGKQQSISCWPRQAKALITELNAMEKF